MKKVSAQQQAFDMLDSVERNILMQNLEPLSPQAQEDLCIAIVAYKRFGIPRHFPNQLLQVIYQSFIELLDKRK